MGECLRSGIFMFRQITIISTVEQQASVSDRYEGRAFMKEISYDLRPITPNYVMMKAGLGNRNDASGGRRSKHEPKTLRNEAIRNANGGQLVSVN
jgi:hypothetical protein